jgi:hypothetical protein
MNPWLTQQVASAHVEELRRSSSRGRIPSGGHTGRRMRIRESLGALLIKTGGRISGVDMTPAEPLMRPARRHPAY